MGELEPMQRHGIRYEKAPRHEDAYRRYVEKGIKPGHFLTAVLEDSLFDAAGRADSTNQELLDQHVRFIWNELPASCWGSEEEVRQWMEKGGLEGTEQED